MKTLRIFTLAATCMVLSVVVAAQNLKTDTIPVSGNCGMCKSKIEKAAKSAGAKEASWDADKKMLTVKYSSSSSNAAKIQQSVAAAGYDTRDVKATDEAYKNLHSCCQYDRPANADESDCCTDKCEMKDGKCTDMAACKDKGCCNADGVCHASHKSGNGTKADCCKKTD